MNRNATKRNIRFPPLTAAISVFGAQRNRRGRCKENDVLQLKQLGGKANHPRKISGHLVKACKHEVTGRMSSQSVHLVKTMLAQSLEHSLRVTQRDEAVADVSYCGYVECLPQLAARTTAI